MLDKFIYSEDRVLISPSVARFGYTTYAISAIRSLRVDPPKRRTGIAILGVIFSLTATLCALDFGFELYKRRMLTFEDEEFGAMLLGLAIIGMALVWTSTHCGPHELVLRTFRGEVVAYASKDEYRLLEIERALLFAISLNARVAAVPFLQPETARRVVAVRETERVG